MIAFYLILTVLLILMWFTLYSIFKPLGEFLEDYILGVKNAMKKEEDKEDGY